MPTITNFGNVVSQGDTTATGNLTIQGTGISSFSSPLSGVTMAGTLAVTGVTTHSSNIIPNSDLACGIGTAAQRMANIYSANINVYSFANIFTANIWSSNVTNTATFQNSVYHFQNTFLTDTRSYMSTAGIIVPATTGTAGLGGPSLLFANSFLQTANIGSSTAQMAMNVTGNVYISNAINVANIFSVTTNASYMNIITGGYANMASINVFTGANITQLTVTTLANIISSNIVTANIQSANIVYSNIQNLNVSVGANTTYLNVAFIANIFTANIITSNIFNANVVSSNIQNLNVSTGANITQLAVTTLANISTGNIVTANHQFLNTVFSNILNLNVSTGANITQLTVTTLSNIISSNIVTANIQSANIVYSNIQNLNVSVGANTTYLNVAFIANIFTANIITANIYNSNIGSSNIQNLNVSTGANITQLAVTTLANMISSNIVTANIYSANIVYSNIQNLNVSTGANTTYLNVAFIANVNTANILTANIQTSNTVYANVQYLNVSYYSNLANLSVSQFANINTANIVTVFHSNLNVSSNANIFSANIFSGNVQTTLNVSGLLSATLVTGNGSALMNLNASNVTMGILPFRNDGAIGQGATAISINGSVGVNNQYLSSTGTSLQWVGPPAAIFSQVPTSVNQIFYNSGNVAIGIYNWTQYGSGFNTYPGVPLDVFGGSGAISFSNVSDANYTGIIRILNSSASWLANGGLEFKTGTNVNGTGHRIVTTELSGGSGVAPLVFQVRSNSKNWSNAMIIQNNPLTPGYVGIGTDPLFQLHIYQPSSSAGATSTLQFSSTSQTAQFNLSNPSGTSTVLYLNGSANSVDGPANSATLRNNAGDLRLAAQSTPSYIYLVAQTGGVGIGTQTMVSSSNISFWCPNVSSSGFAHTVSADSKLGVSLYAGDPGQGQFVITGITNTNKRLAFMYDTSNNISLIQSMTNGTGANPLILNAAGGYVGVGLTTPPRQFSMYGEFALVSPYAQSYFNVCDSAGSNGGNYTLYLRGLGSSGGAQVNMAGCYIYANNTYIAGNFGVGTTGPSDLVHVYGTSNPSIRIDAGSGGTTDPRLHFYSGSTFRGRVAYSYGGGYMYYQNDTQDVMRFYNGTNGSVSLQPIGGNVGISITNPLFNLQVGANGGYIGSTTIHLANSYLDSSGQFGARITALDNGVNGHNLQIQTRTSAYGGFTNSMTVTASGRVGINSTGPNSQLEVNTTGTIGIVSTGSIWGHRIIYGSYGVSSYQDGSTFYYLITNSGDQYGSYNGLRPFYFSLSSGYVTMNNGVTINSGSTVNGGLTSSGDIYASATNANIGINRGAIWFNTIGDSNHYLYNNYNNRDGAGGFDGMKWNTYNGLWIRGGSSGANTGFFLNSSGNVGIGFTTQNYKFEVYGRSYYWGTSNGGGGQNQFTGLEADSSANGRAQKVLNSAYSDMVICSSQANGTHGSTVSFVTNSTANNDYRKFVINVGNWSGYGSGGYGDRMSFGWKDGAYPNPHSYVTPSDSVMMLDGRNKRVGINNIDSPGYNIHVNGNDYATGGRYTSDYFRVYGGGGIYWESYGGGWFMSDSTFMRAYGNKYIYTAGQIRCAGGFSVDDGTIIVDNGRNHYGYFRFYVDTWHNDAGYGYNRFYFANGGRTYYKSPNGHEFRRNDDNWILICNDDLTIDMRSTVRMNGQLQTQSNSIDMQSGHIYLNNNGASIYWGGGASRIYDDGNLHINTDDYMYFSAPNEFYFSSGPIHCTNDIVAYYSDERLKNKTGLIVGALDKVKKLSGFYYTNNELANSFGFNDKDVKVGVSAQEVQEVLPMAVKPAPFDCEKGQSKSGEDYLTVQYEKLVPLLIEALKEEAQKREELEKLVQKLLNKE